MSINKATLTKIVNGNTEYIYPKTTSDLVQYNSNNTVKDILDGLNSTYLSISNASTNYLKKTDASNIYLNKTDASSKYVTTTNGIAYGRLDVVSDETDNANLFIRSLDDGYSNIFIGNHDNATYCSITLDPNNIFSLKYNGVYILRAASENVGSSSLTAYNIKFYGTADRAGSDGNGNNISTTYLKKTDITQSDVMGSILVNGEYIEVYDDSEIYAELDNIKSNYLTKTGTAAKATADGSGNTITSTYLKLTGGTLSGDLTIGSTANANEARVNVRNSGHVGWLTSSAAGNFGIYTSTFSKWVVWCSSAGVVTLNGNAATATKATQDSSGTKLSIDAGDNLSFNGIYAGHLTNSGKEIHCFIPTARIIHGTLTCTSFSCVIRHADGGYPYARSGSSGSTYTQLGSSQTSIWASSKTVRTNEIASITCTSRTDGVQVTIAFTYQLTKSSGDTTTVVNNVPLSVYCNGEMACS